MTKQRTTTENKGGTAKRVDALHGVSGRVRFQAGSAARTYSVEEGALKPEDPSATSDSVITFEGEQLLEEIFTGKKNPVVMALQGRLRVEGNLELATRVLLGLQSEAGDSGKQAAAEVQS